MAVSAALFKGREWVIDDGSDRERVPIVFQVARRDAHSDIYPSVKGKMPLSAFALFAAPVRPPPPSAGILAQVAVLVLLAAAAPAGVIAGRGPARGAP